jgi:serine protein kinase
MGFLEELENENALADKPRWKGTFRDFLMEYKKGRWPNAGILAHQRVRSMILSAGIEKVNHFGVERKKYKFFEDVLFGIEDTIDGIMQYVNSAADRTETSRRLLLLYGPPSSGKSEIVARIKRGLERFTRSDEGAVFAIEGSPMHENPFLLVPDYLREKFAAEYGVVIEGQLSPITQWRLDNEFKGKFMDFPVQQIYFSEAARVGIGTWLPSDTKSQDISELLGGLDYARIQDVGNEADPRAYNFNGELNVANRGVMEFIEGLKADEKFLRANLTATQEKSIKAPRFGLISVDCFIIIHTNEEEFVNFMNEKKYEAYHDRMVMVPAKYNLGYGDEVKIFQKLLYNSDALKHMHLAPHCLEVAGIFAVLSRLEHSEHENLMKKMKLYNKEHVKGRKIEEVPDLKRRSPREGMTGISPRFVIDQIAIAISKAKEEDRHYIIPLDVLRQLHEGIRISDRFKPEEKQKFDEYLGYAREELNELIRNDIQKAFFLEFAAEAKALCDTYLDHIEAALSHRKPRDPVTNEEIEVNTKLIESIESQIGITNNGREDFRNEILRAFTSAARKNHPFDYTQHAQLKEAIQKQLFHEREGVIRLTVSSRNPDPEGLKRINEVVERMCDQQGYTPASANAILKYASSHLFPK